MKVYKVYFEKLSFDRGCFEGYVTKRYYATEEKAEAVKATIKKGVCTGEAYIEEIEVEE